MSNTIKSAIKNACESFAKTVQHFDFRAITNEKGYSDNGFPEKNLSFHFAKEFTGKKGRNVFLEMPFAKDNNKCFLKKPKGRNHKLIFNQHIDGIAKFGKNLVIWETKRLFRKDKLEAVCKDADRLANQSLKKGILNRFSDEEYENVYALILCETWRNIESKKNLHLVEWWKTLDYGKHKNWDKICKKSKLKNFTFKSNLIHEYGSYSYKDKKNKKNKTEKWAIYCLWALIKLK